MKVILTIASNRTGTEVTYTDTSPLSPAVAEAVEDSLLPWEWVTDERQA